MNKWLPLVAAIALEVTATLSLRAALDHKAHHPAATGGGGPAGAALCRPSAPEADPSPKVAV